jgi:hypothetical protein
MDFPQEVRRWIDRELAAIPEDVGVHYERRLAREHRAAIIGCNHAYYFFLAVTGELYQLDIDDVRLEMQLVTNPERMRDVLATCAASEPILRALVTR